MTEEKKKSNICQIKSPRKRKKQQQINQKPKLDYTADHSDKWEKLKVNVTLNTKVGTVVNAHMVLRMKIYIYIYI